MSKLGRKGGQGRTFEQRLVENSSLRGADPRAKLALCICASLAVMLPLERLLVFLAAFLLLVVWARLLPEVGRQTWRLRWVLLFLFIGDTLLIGLELAVTITLRVALLGSVFALLFSTTTPRELGLALEIGVGKVRLPYRYAFSISLAIASLGILDEEWRAIREAQTARGLKLDLRGLRQIWQQAGELVAFTVPAIVLTTRRAWNATEAAYSRGFDSPMRKPFHQLVFHRKDALLLAGCLVYMLALFFWR